MAQTEKTHPNNEPWLKEAHELALKQKEELELLQKELAFKLKEIETIASEMLINTEKQMTASLEKEEAHFVMSLQKQLTELEQTLSYLPSPNLSQAEELFLQLTNQSPQTSEEESQEKEAGQ